MATGYYFNKFIIVSLYLDIYGLTPDIIELYGMHPICPIVNMYSSFERMLKNGSRRIRKTTQ